MTGHASTSRVAEPKWLRVLGCVAFGYATIVVVAFVVVLVAGFLLGGAT